MWKTDLVSTRLPGHRSVVNIRNQECIDISDIGISGGATEFGYGLGGPWTILASTGRGTSRKSNRVNLTRVRLHHTGSAIMSIYGGIDKWQVNNCRFDHASRGGFNSNGARNTVVNGCHFGPGFGDDPLMFGGSSYNSVVSNCVLGLCPRLGHHRRGRN